MMYGGAMHKLGSIINTTLPPFHALENMPLVVVVELIITILGSQ
jgi:hypothetical protein